jgi:hypothetical protein
LQKFEYTTTIKSKICIKYILHDSFTKSFRQQLGATDLSFQGESPMAPASETSSLHQRDKKVDVAIAGDDLRLIGTLTSYQVSNRGSSSATGQDLDRKLVTD